MQAAKRPTMTEAEYLELDARSPERYEFVNGEAVAMAGADPAYGAVVLQFGAVLRARLAGRPCLVWSESQRVHVDETGLYAYPDLVMTCGRPQFADTTPRSLLNPLVIVEVLSPSTEAYDRGAKFAHYQRRTSLREYVLVSPDERRIDHYERQDGNTWLYKTYVGDETLSLPALGLEIPLAEIYVQAELLRELTAEE